MERLAKEWEPPGHRFAFLHVREAHPGEHYPHHSSMEQKLAPRRRRLH